MRGFAAREPPARTPHPNPLSPKGRGALCRHCPPPTPPLEDRRAPGEDMLLSLFTILDFLLQVLMWIIIIQAILSWLVAFNVINTYNHFVASFLTALDRM